MGVSDTELALVPSTYICHRHQHLKKEQGVLRDRLLPPGSSDHQAVHQCEQDIQGLLQLIQVLQPWGQALPMSCALVRATITAVAGLLLEWVMLASFSAVTSTLPTIPVVTANIIPCWFPWVPETTVAAAAAEAVKANTCLDSASCCHQHEQSKICRWAHV
jgi:hypothetical protein